MAKNIMYVIETNNPNGEFAQSVWAGEGYATRAEAKAHLDFWKQRGMFKNEKLTIGKEDLPGDFFSWLKQRHARSAGMPFCHFS